VNTHTHTQQADCVTWTTNLSSNRIPSQHSRKSGWNSVGGCRNRSRLFGWGRGVGSTRGYWTTRWYANSRTGRL